MLRYMAFLFMLPFLCGAEEKNNEFSYQDNLINVVYQNNESVIFVGKKSLNGGSDAAGSMMYPAPDASVFLVSILTHAVVAGGVNSSKLKKEQEEADKVLTDYLSDINKINPPSLMEDILDGFADGDAINHYKVLHSASVDNNRWQLYVSPVFALTQRQDSIILYNKFTFNDKAAIKVEKLKKLKKGSIPDNEKIIVVVSDPIKEENKKNYWLKDGGLNFIKVVSEIHEQSFQLALEAYFLNRQAAIEKQVTIKYLEDGQKKIERGYVVSQSCERTVFKSLAGEIKSVPNINFFNCAQSGEQPIAGIN